jgi:zinc protease
MRAGNRLAMVVAVLVAASALNLAQAPAPSGQAPQSPTKGVVPKGKAPVADTVLRVTLPRPKEADLPNGIHLLVLEDRRVPQVSFSMLIPGAGGYFDPADHSGLASFTASMMREGTATRTSQQISEELETIAATLNVSTGASSIDATAFGSSLTEHVGKLVDLTADVLLRPSFPDDELARFKQRTKAQLVQQRSFPGFLASELFARVIYGEHPASRVSPTPQALEKTTRESLVNFYKTHFVPDHAILAIAGDISFDEARQLVERTLGKWSKSGVPAPKPTDPPPLLGPKVHLVARPNSVQTNLWVGTQAINRTSPDYDVLQVMNKVIGGGPTGRLFIHLREDKGYTYGAYSGISAGQYRGAWNASTDVRTEVTEPALRDLMAEIAMMRDQPVPAAELRDAKRSMVAAFALSLENPAQVLNYYITRYQYKLAADYWDKYPERINAITAAHVQAAARKYLDSGRIQIVAVGDAAKVAQVLKGFGTVDMYDTEGQRINQ